MKDERDLDRAIDTAARELVAREPSRALSYTVMARVRENNAPARRPLMWATAVATLLLCSGITIALMNRTAAPVVTSPPVAQ